MSPLPIPQEDGPQFQFTSLTDQDREDIVDLSANFNIAGAAYIPVSRFDLTPLGADVDLDGRWNSPVKNLVGWRHIATSGRDHYVKVVRRGYLFPLGHRAVHISLIERVLSDDPAHGSQWSDAVLLLKQFIKITQPVKTYPASGQPFNANSWPFKTVELKTIVTPAIDPPADLVAGSPQAFMVTVGGSDFLWSTIATDAGGHETHLHIPQVFMYGFDQNSPYLDEFNVTTTSPIQAAYNALGAAGRSANANSSLVKFAPEAGGKPGATTHPTLKVTIAAALPTIDPTTPTTPSPVPSKAALKSAQQPAFYPVLQTAKVRLPAAEGLSRGSFDDSTGPGIGIQFFPDFVAKGLPVATNPGTVYAELTDAFGPAGAPPLKFPGDAVGGIGTPNVGIEGLSAVAGTVAGDLVAYAGAGALTGNTYFKSVPGLSNTTLPQLLGGLKLSDILGTFQNAFGLPTIVNQLDPTTGARTITYTLTAALQASPTVNPVFVPTGSGGTMKLTSVTQIVPGMPPTYHVKGTITPFTIQIIGSSGGLNFILIPFNKLTFTSQNGSKPDVKADVGQVQFQGDLEWLNALEKFLEGLGGSGFAVSVTAKEIKAGFSIGLPTISMGMVTIQNISLAASVVIPFVGAPALATFSFASQEHQFLVTVSMFGGGGYVSLVLGLTKVQKVACDIEFAGNFSLDIGIASGGITVTAGISYLYQAGQGVTLTGFVRMHGELDVLGMISISVDLDLELSYHTDGSSSYVVGTASLSVAVHIIFFTVTVGFTVHKQFAGSSNNTTQSAHALGFVPVVGAARTGPEFPSLESAPHSVGPGAPDPVTPTTFESLINTANTWNEYCSAFAA